jgi:hypothetical protein
MVRGLFRIPIHHRQIHFLSTLPLLLNLIFKLSQDYRALLGTKMIQSNHAEGAKSIRWTFRNALMIIKSPGLHKETRDFIIRKN